MTPEETLLAALAKDPGDSLAWLALADGLEEAGEAQRAELVRLTHQLPTLSDPIQQRPLIARINILLAAGTWPCRPRTINSIGQQLVLIAPGQFHMGSPEDEDRRHQDELSHEVRLTRPFWMSSHLVTQQQFRRVMGFNPAGFSALGANRQLVEGMDTEDFPVECVNWHEAIEFCGRLTRMEGGGTYRLPTEAEWEYACRAGTATPFYSGFGLSSHQANYDGNSPYLPEDLGPELGRPSPVGSYLPNPWGLFDMHGNLDEWCHDWYDENYYHVSFFDNPQGPDSGEMRVMRGGTWGNSGRFCRSAFRWRASPEVRQHEKGFRIVQDLTT